MKLLIADTFTRSLGKLEAVEQALVKAKAFDLQVNPEKPGGEVHRLTGLKEKNFWTYYVNDEIRIIFHQLGDSRLVCYTGHHEQAYRWVKDRRVQQHPRTGAIQIVEVEERVEEVVRTVLREIATETPLFRDHEPSYLLDLGVPEQWIDAVRTVGEKGFLKLLEHLPPEAAERLFQLASGNAVPRPVRVEPGQALEHPDTKRRIRVIESTSELHRALEFPLEQWLIFLHPLQRVAVDKAYRGSALVKGGAGTGKTVVALHRAAHLAQSRPAARVLLTTFSRTLAIRLERSAGILLGDDHSARARIHIAHLHSLALEIWQKRTKRTFRPLDPQKFVKMLTDARTATGVAEFTLPFLKAEWDGVVEPSGTRDWAGYQKVSRVGRGVSLGARQRQTIWRIFEKVLETLNRDGLMTWGDLCRETTMLLGAESPAPFDHLVADEAQDFGPSELRLLRALVGAHDDDIFLAADEGQRIYQGHCVWSQLGIDVRGRSTRLKVNYRTTDQIRSYADDVVSKVTDQDGEKEGRATVSLLTGPPPETKFVSSVKDETEAVLEWVRGLLKAGYGPRDIAIFARTESVLRTRAEPVAQLCGVGLHHLRSDDFPPDDCLSVGSMHRAKGLEFKAVAVMGCEEGLVPLRTILRDLVDEADKEALLEQERNLLYVALTRARERLLVTGVGKPCAFLERMGS